MNYTQQLNKLYPGLQNNPNHKKTARKKATQLKGKLAKATAATIPALAAFVPINELEAQIVHNPGHLTFPITISTGVVYNTFDIDGDGNNDFSIDNTSTSHRYFAGRGAFYSQNGAIGVLSTASNDFVSASRLQSGNCISSNNLVVPQTYTSNGTTTNLGHIDLYPADGWTNPSSGFLGVRFISDAVGGGATNTPVYGWVAVSFAADGTMQITGLAYEASGAPLAAGDTGTNNFATCTPPPGASPTPTPIPTLSQWGVFLFSLTTLTLGLLGFLNVQRQRLLAGFQNMTNQQAGLHIPFDKKGFWNAMKITLGIVPLGFAFIYSVWGEIIIDDLIGMSFAIPIVAYLIYLIKMKTVTEE